MGCRWTDLLLPVGDDTFLDHVGYFSGDLSRSGAQLARLGFQVSGVNVQYRTTDDGASVVTGTSNRLVKLRRGFLEVLAATSSTSLAAQMEAAVRRYEGLHLIALTHADVNRERRRIVDAGFPMQEVVELRRWVDAAGGRRQMAYSVLRTEPGLMPEGRVQLVTTHTPDLFWTPGVTGHLNGAVALTDVIVCVADVDEAAERFSRFLGRNATVTTAEQAVLVTDRGTVVLVDISRASALFPEFTAPDLPYMAGVAVRTESLGRAHQALADNAVEPVDFPSGLCVRPSDALGSYLIFHDLADGVCWDPPPCDRVVAAWNWFADPAPQATRRGAIRR